MRWSFVLGLLGIVATFSGCKQRAGNASSVRTVSDSSEATIFCRTLSDIMTETSQGQENISYCSGEPTLAPTNTTGLRSNSHVAVDTALRQVLRNVMANQPYTSQQWSQVNGRLKTISLLASGALVPEGNKIADGGDDPPGGPNGYNNPLGKDSGPEGPPGWYNGNGVEVADGDSDPPGRPNGLDEPAPYGSTAGGLALTQGAIADQVLQELERLNNELEN